MHQPSGSSDVHHGDFIPMQADTPTAPLAYPGNAAFGHTNYNTQSVPQIGNYGNSFNTVPFNTNQGFLQDAGISPGIARELQKLRDMISNVPGIVRPIAEVPTDSHRISRFVPSISNVQIPKKFQTPNMKLYDGSTDPEEHVAQYRERMEINPIPMEIKEACLCKGFGSTLTGAAMKWLLSIPPNTIHSFSHLVNLFNNQFSCSRSFEKTTGDLYRITQNHGESLRDFITRFSKEALEIPNLNPASAVEALKLGLDKDSSFYDDIVMTPCRSLDEARSRALRYIRLEDDKKNAKVDIPKYDQTNRKFESPGKNYRAKPYQKPDIPRINAVDEDDNEEYPKISEYCFSVDTGGLICAMQDLGEKARWPRKVEKPGFGKDKSKWCAYHEDFGHLTNDCIALRKEISYLLSKGHLKELFGRRKGRE